MSVFEKGPSVSKVITGGSLTFLLAMIAGVFAWIFGVTFTRVDIGLGREAYGIFITGQAVIVIIGCITFGVNQSIQKYVAEFLVTDKEKAEKYARNGVISIIIFALIACIILSISGIFLFPSNTLIGLSLIIIGPSLLIISLKDGIIGNLAAIQRFDYVAVINASFSVGLFIVGIPIILFIIKPNSASPYTQLAPLTLLGLTCSYIIQVIVAGYYGRKSLPFNLRNLHKGSKDIRIMGKVFKYGLYCAIPTIILSGSILWIPALLISAFGGSAATGLFGVIVGYAFMILTISFMGWPMISAVSEARAMGDQKLIDDYFRNNFKSSFNFISLFLTIFVGLAGPILTIFHGSDYRLDGQIPFIILAVGVAILALEFISCTIVIGAGEGKKASIVFIIITLSEIALTVLFLNVFPVAHYAAPCAILISSLLMFPFIVKLLKFQTSVPFPRETLWKSSVSIIIAIGVGFLINYSFNNYFYSLIGIVIGGVVLAGMYILSMLLLAGYDDEDFEMIYDSLDTFKLGFLTRLIKSAEKLSQKSPFYKKKGDSNKLLKKE